MYMYIELPQCTLQVMHNYICQLYVNKAGKKLAHGMKNKNKNIATEFDSAPPPKKIELQNINDYLGKLLFYVKLISSYSPVFLNVSIQ